MFLQKTTIAFMFIFLGWNNPTIEDCETLHEIEILHPGIDLEKPIQKILVQSNCDSTGIMEYYMDVESVVCGDSQCRIDIIRLFWDELGFYKKLELPDAVELEKAGGASFTPEDYLKLDSILSNKNSSLKYVDKYEVTGSETSEGIDALSGATIALDVKSYVKGAVWTCYTLWHWSNGSIADAIRDITGDGLTSKELVNDLKKGSHEQQVFALQQVIRKKWQDSDTTEAVLELASQESSTIQKLCVKYVERLSGKLYSKSIESLLKKNNTKLSLLALNSFLRQEQIICEKHIDEFGEQIFARNSYQQIDLFLKILEKREEVPVKAVKECLLLLEHDNFLIARRAYWFLSEQKNLLDEHERALELFYKKYNDKL